MLSLFPEITVNYHEKECDYCTTTITFSLPKDAGMNSKLELVPVHNIETIQDLLLYSAKKYGPKLALEDLAATPVSAATYDQLLHYVLKFGNALRKLGIPERAHIAVIGENRVQWALTYLTALSFNYVIVPIDRNLTQNEIENIIYESDAEAIVFSNGFRSMLAETSHVLKKLKVFIDMDSPENKDGMLSMSHLLHSTDELSVADLPEIDPDQIGEIIFTSGSLGRAKGVMLSQGNLAANLMGMRSYILIKPEDKFLSVLPMHHTYECTCGLLCPLYSGASAHYARSLKTITDDMVRVHPTIVLGVPLLFEKMFKRIYKAIEQDKVKSLIMKPLVAITDLLTLVGWKNAKLRVFKELHEKFGGEIRMFIVGGAAPDVDVAKGLRSFGFGFIQGYGLTETSPIAALNRLEAFKDEAAGLPLPGLTVKISNKDENGVGEILVKGKSVMLGYYKNEELTKQVFEDGFFKTGDLGFIDEEGFLHISGRKKNVIITPNGKNVFPEEIEDILNKSPFVQESMVYAGKWQNQKDVISALIYPDPEAFIELAEKSGQKITPELLDKTIADVVKEVNAELPSFKRIMTFHLKEREFEKTTTQKIKRYLVSLEQ
jgi:long-chain acyl-CoA synthetase